MKIPSYVKPIPFSFYGVPPGFAFLDKVYLRKDIYEDLLSHKPSPQSVGYLIHEQTHRKRIGKSMFITYWLNPNLRFQEELAADKERFRYLKKHNVKFDFDKRAKDLSGISYLWCTSYKNAVEELKKVWKQV